MPYKIVETIDSDRGTSSRVLTQFNNLKLAKNFIRAYAQILTKSSKKITVSNTKIEAITPNGNFKWIKIAQ